MIWGQTKEQAKAAFERPTLVFAWRPIRLVDGRWAWMTHVLRKWVEDEGANWAGDGSRYEYEEWPGRDV